MPTTYEKAAIEARKELEGLRKMAYPTKRKVAKKVREVEKVLDLIDSTEISTVYKDGVVVAVVLVDKEKGQYREIIWERDSDDVQVPKQVD